MATRHLVVLDKSIDKTTRRELKSLRRTEVDLVSAYELDDVEDRVRTKYLERKSVQWDTISLLFNVHRDEHAPHTTVMGVLLHVDVDDKRFKTCPGNHQFQTLVRTLSAMVVSSGVAHRGIYLHAFNLGPMAGWQQLLKTATETQVHLSHDLNQSYGVGVGWKVKWGNKDWYDLNPDQRKHAKRYLFHTLLHQADETSTYDMYRKYHKENRQSTRYDDAFS